MDLAKRLTTRLLSGAGAALFLFRFAGRLGRTLDHHWFENSYPGCRVDVSNHFYAYSFEPNHDWSEYYSQRDELRDYFEHCATKYHVRPHIQFETEVTELRWDDARSVWAVTTRTKDGVETTGEWHAVVSGVGQLNRPKFPDIPGIEDFEGPAFHSAKWQPARIPGSVFRS